MFCLWLFTATYQVSRGAQLNSRVLALWVALLLINEDLQIKQSHMTYAQVYIANPKKKYFPNSHL
jgi:hypothetical protein